MVKIVLINVSNVKKAIIVKAEKIPVNYVIAKALIKTKKVKAIVKLAEINNTAILIIQDV